MAQQQNLRFKGEGARLDGGRQIKKALKDTGAALTTLKEPGRRAAQLVYEEAAARAQGERDSGDFISSMLAKGTQYGGQVEAGGRRAPHFIVREFGGTIPRYKSTRRTKAKPRSPGYRGGSEGYFLFPALRALKPRIVELYHREVDRIIDQHLHGG